MVLAATATALGLDGEQLIRSEDPSDPLVMNALVLATRAARDQQNDDLAEAIAFRVAEIFGGG